MQLKSIFPAVLTIVFVGVVMGIGLYVMYSVESGIPGGSAAINQTAEGLGTLSSWIPIIAVVVAAAIVLGVVISSFGAFGGRASTTMG